MIRRMFGDIAPRYDFLNHFLSFNRDRAWRRRAARELEIRPGERVLDLCTGTADLALELSRGIDPARGGVVVGADFCPQMVTLGEAKRARRGDRRVALVVADALQLPFATGTFDAASVAFGVRNLCGPQEGLAELRRVLRPGGRLAVLEFTTPSHPLFRRVYGFYFHHVLPFLGSWLSGHRSGARAYRYLPESVTDFPGPEAFTELLRKGGFHQVRCRLLTAGIVQLHLAAALPREAESRPRLAGRA